MNLLCAAHTLASIGTHRAQIPTLALGVAMRAARTALSRGRETVPCFSLHTTPPHVALTVWLSKGTFGGTVMRRPNKIHIGLVSTFT